MLDLTTGEMFFYGGVTVMAASLLMIIAAIIIFRITGKRIKARLEAEFGKEKHWR